MSTTHKTTEEEVKTGKAPAPTDAKPADKAVSAERAKDEKEIARLQAEYDDLKVKAEQEAALARGVAPALVRKGEVTRQIDALKRKHDLP